MALFDKDETEKKAYIALLDKDGENILAFVTPVKGLKPELLVEKLNGKGINCEVRESKGDIVDIEL